MKAMKGVAKLVTLSCENLRMPCCYQCLWFSQPQRKGWPWGHCMTYFDCVECCLNMGLPCGLTSLTLVCFSSTCMCGCSDDDTLLDLVLCTSCPRKPTSDKLTE